MTWYIRYLLLLLIICTPCSHAEFALNFEPVAEKYQSLDTHWGIGPPLDYWGNGGESPTDWDHRYTRWTGNSVQTYGEGGVRLFGQSPFLIQHTYGSIDMPELVYDETTGKRYWHIVIADPYNNFKQEVFIETASVAHGERFFFTNGYPINSSFSASPDTTAYYDLPGSASGGRTDDLTLNGGSQIDGGNQTRIFSDDAGNGTADPRKVIIRQTLNDNEIAMEFLKEQYSKKPRITQTINTESVSAYFELDMRELDYVSVQDTPGEMTNRFQLVADAPYVELGSFDSTDIKFADDVKMNVTAGMYAYVPYSGPDRQGYAPGSGGSYVYYEGGFDHYSINWGSYLNRATFEGGFFEVVNKETGETEVKFFQGVSADDRVEIKGDGYIWTGSFDTWFVQKTDQEDTYQKETVYVNPWSYSQENICDYAHCL